MAGWRDPPPHTAAPPDGGYRGALARHVRHVRPVGDDGVFLLFHDRLGRVISSTSTSNIPVSLQVLNFSFQSILLFQSLSRMVKALLNSSNF